MKILVTGLPGCIGSHIVEHAQDLNHEFSIQDDFSVGNKWAIKDYEIFELDLLDRDNLFKKLLKKVLGRILNYSSIHKITHSSSDLHKNLFPSI